MIVYLVRHYVFAVITLIYGRDAKTCFNGGGAFKPFVIIVIPAHNEEKVIGRLLEGICQFSHPGEKLDVIVVDDGSTDKTEELVDAFSREYGFVKTLHRSSACGKAAALNEALKHAHGEIVYFFDADYVPMLILLSLQTVLFMI